MSNITCDPSDTDNYSQASTDVPQVAVFDTAFHSTIPEAGTSVVLYVDSFGRFEGNVVRCDDGGFGVAFVCTPSKRERTAEQLILFLNKTLVDDNVMRDQKHPMLIRTQLDQAAPK